MINGFILIFVLLPPSFKNLIIHFMKKSVLALVALTFLFSACNKDGVYAPKKKITAVYYQKAGSEQRELLESYHWDGNKLNCKLFRGGVHNPYSGIDYEITPTYDGKRIIRVDENYSGDYVDYQYNGKLLCKLIYHSGNDFVEAPVEHKDGKISKISIPAKTISKDCLEKFLGIILPQNDIQYFNLLLQKAPKELSSIGAELLFSWDGDNVAECTFNLHFPEGITNKVVSKYKYDDMKNPFHINWANFGTEIEIISNTNFCIGQTMSENNIVQIDNEITTLLSSGSTLINYNVINNISYEYDGKYPVKAIRTYESSGTKGTFYYEYLN